MLSTAFLPFTFAFVLLAGLVLLELVALLLGGSLIGSDAPEVDLDPGLDAEPDIDALLAGGPETELAPDGFGLRGAPLIIWLAAALLGFGAAGVMIQSLAAALSAPLPLWGALPLALVAGLGFARAFGRAFARLIPRIETTATSTQFMGGLRGIVTQGTARRGQAAEVRLRDRHGNLHHLRCEPYREDDVIPEGAEVLTIRRRAPDGSFILRIIATT
ncbi:OB-fold-containig protein [Stagnihabitans tardus]|uniref:OB-fold-containig protein n=1 Tax=Stagnihabitans tardus TaxID=2699202 RepID=UPI001D0F64E9|nr:OB-fold-containig protein [Stagnihabitans tardus]